VNLDAILGVMDQWVYSKRLRRNMAKEQNAEAIIMNNNVEI